MKKKNSWKILGIIIFIVSLVFICLGFDKLIDYGTYSNKYVGGDAYNFIINASKATAYFVLATFFLLLSIGCGIFYYFSNLKINTEIGKNKDISIKNNSQTITSMNEQWVCTTCGTINDSKNRFCNKCGSKHTDKEEKIDILL